MANTPNTNPFAGLFQAASPTTPSESIKTVENEKINEILTRVFRITLDASAKHGKQSLVYLGEPETGQFLTQDNLDEILLQRLMLTDRKSLEERLIGPKSDPKSPTHTTNQFIYLFWCFKRLEDNKNDFDRFDGLYEQCRGLIANILRSLLTILDETTDTGVSVMSIKFVGLIKVVYLDDGLESGDEAIFEQFFDLFMKGFEKSDQDWSGEGDLVDDPVELNFFNHIFTHINTSLIDIRKCEDLSADYFKSMKLVNLLGRSKLMKYLLIMNSNLSPEVKTQRARRWQTDTILGKLLSPSVLPLEPFKLVTNPAQLLGGGEPLQNNYKYFLNPTQLTRQDVEIAERNMHDIQRLVKKEINKFFYENLIKTNSNQRIRSAWLRWLGACLDDNKAKAQEWSNYAQSPLLPSNNFASDGFFLNLLDLLLTYSMPFCSQTLAGSNRLMKINFNYPNRTLSAQNFVGFEKETMLIPRESSFSLPSELETDSRFNDFITECYFATNSVFRLSFLSINQKIVKLNGELARMQQTYQDLVMSQTQDPQMVRLKNMFENMSVEFMNLKTVLLEDDLMKKSSKFLFNSSAWLCYMAVGVELADFKSDSTLISKLDNIELLKNPSRPLNLSILSCIPEYFLTSIVDFVVFLNRFKESSIDEVLMDGQTNDHLNSFVSLILTFMGRADRTFNPHIRASLAEALECLLPKKQQRLFNNRPGISFAAFVKHPCAGYISEALLNVFVSIEMTGQSVQFEQKFNYRRPMYELIDFLWNIPKHFEDHEQVDESLLRQHQTVLKSLSINALENMDDTIEQPLFLKFLNYLINDANFLLVEGLLYLEKIKINQDKLADDQINKTLTNSQRSEIQSSLKHMIMLAKFHNLMSSKTISTLKMLTTEIKLIFCHSTLVDRVATMLNDFLLHLVGKKKRKQLKVKNFDEVEFKPREMVSGICQIYLNLGGERGFCEAVCRDERSYSPELFQSAIEVLEQINLLETTERFKEFAAGIERLAEERREDESSYENAPEEYLDPIQFSLMTDPVILPSSKKIVDRSTIARHLLSDQTDPFNRSPLTLNQVIPASELKLEIENWKKNLKNNQT